MKKEEYDDRVRSSTLETLAEEEGRLRAQAEIRSASAARVQKDSEHPGLPKEARDSALQEIASSRGYARAMIAEADAISARSADIGGWSKKPVT